MLSAFRAGWLVWLVAVNLVTLAAFVYDKWASRSRPRGRVRERTLLAFLWAGGVAGGAIGMLRFRHKTRHGWFWAALWAGSALHLAVLVVLFGVLR